MIDATIPSVADVSAGPSLYKSAPASAGKEAQQSDWENALSDARASSQQSANLSRMPSGIARDFARMSDLLAGMSKPRTRLSSGVSSPVGMFSARPSDPLLPQAQQGGGSEKNARSADLDQGLDELKRVSEYAAYLSATATMFNQGVGSMNRLLQG
jgi:hypothetical protein